AAMQLRYAAISRWSCATAESAAPCSPPDAPPMAAPIAAPLSAMPKNEPAIAPKPAPTAAPTSAPPTAPPAAASPCEPAFARAQESHCMLSWLIRSHGWPYAGYGAVRWLSGGPHAARPMQRTPTDVTLSVRVDIIPLDEGVTANTHSQSS